MARPPTARSAKAAVSKGLAPKGKAGPPKSSKSSTSQRGLPGKNRTPALPPTSPDVADLANTANLPRMAPRRSLPPSSAFSVNAPPLAGPSAPLGVGHSSYPSKPRVGAGMSEAMDTRLDKKAGIKPGSPRDNALDRKRGVPVRKKRG